MIRAAVPLAVAAVVLAPLAHADQPDTQQVIRYVHQHYPEVAHIGTVRADRLPDHPSGRAADLMIPGWNTPDGKALGDRIADDLMAHADQLGIKYVIWQQTYRPVGGAPKHMRDRGSANANHYTHVHVTTWGTRGTGVH